MSKPATHFDDTEQIGISWASREIAAKLCRTDRRVLKIQVDPGGQVIVFAPNDASYEVIAVRCQRKGAWIFRELDRIQAEPAFTPHRCYLSGETHLLAGRPYRLAVERSANPFVRIDGARLIIGAREPNDAAHCRRLLTAFYAIEARSIFPSRLSAMLPPFERRGLERPHLIIRRMTKRWGSYTPSGSITLNVDLVRAGPDLIDYVICHELAHAFYGDHSKGWRELLCSLMPDWVTRKAQLEMVLR
jgi:predicted metal-dependent hydrolase